MNNTTASNSSQRIPTATSQNMTTGLGSPRHGMKQDIEDIYGKLQEHDDALSRMDQIVEKNGALADDNIKVGTRLCGILFFSRSIRFFWGGSRYVNF